MTDQAPGPKGLPLIGHYLDLRRDILALMVSTREQYGDVVRFKLGPRTIHVINHPDLARQVLVTRRDNYDKTARSSQQIKHLAGMSLLVSNGEDWQVKRRLLQPAFKINTVTAYFDLMQQLAEDATDRLGKGAVIDMSSFMMHLTYRIVGMALLSDDLDKTSDQWVQIWNDAGGSQINIRGGMTDDGMLLTGTIHYVANGTTAAFRGLWTPLPDGRVRQFFEQSSDDGETWTPWFEGFYTRKPADAAEPRNSN